jgi:release factor glutamine methyltransferase
MEATFFGLTFLTAPGRVFTPRPTTERLVEAALARVGVAPARIADVGTGAGVIAVATAVRAPAAEVWATDTNPEAVRLARLNARRHSVTDRVHIAVGDLLEPVPGLLDVVAANLPYLPDTLRGLSEYEAEPAAAVYAPAHGLAHYRRLLADAEVQLAPAGVLLIQFHREILAADRDGLPALRDRLERLQSAQWVAS